MTAEGARAFLVGLNECWQTGDLASIAAYYHPDVVLLPPDLGEPIIGREAVVASYGEFLQAATLDHFEITDLDIFSFEPDTATCVAHLTFEVVYALDGDTYVEKGLEVYTLGECNGEPKILWRHQNVLDSRVKAKA
jgi:ketosteroid isomerase-like protein